MATKLIKNSFVKKALKEHSGASQIGGDALDRVDELFLEFLIQVATAAAESLKADDGSKLSAADIDFGFQKILNQSRVPTDPKRYVEALAEDIKFEQLGEVLEHLVAWNSREDKKMGLS